jgi:hypothetical protein
MFIIRAAMGGKFSWSNFVKTLKSKPANAAIMLLGFAGFFLAAILAYKYFTA